MEDNKIYGTSVLNIKPDNSESSTSAFDEELLTPKMIDKERELLKSENQKGNEIVKTDAITGIKSSSHNDDSEEDFKKICDIINERDIKGKTLTNSGISMIKDLLKSDPTEDELSNISKYFETIESKSDIGFSAAESALGERISNKIKDICNDNEYESVLIRFAEQLYNTYHYIVQYNDDMRDLTKLAKRVNDYSSQMHDETKSEITDIDKEYDNLINIQSDIMSFMDRLKNLDDRNKRLKQDYTIDDYDIRTVESVKKCLDTAISFSKVYRKVENTKDKFKKDFKNDRYVDNSIEDWIQDIKNDSHTLFTLPVNDYLTPKESRIQITEFFYNALIADILYRNFDEIPGDEEDYENYLIKTGYLDSNKILEYKTKARLTLYVLSRAFKYKKLVEDDERRILSYTLDIISKLGVTKYRDEFIKMVNYCFDNIICE